MPILQKGLLPDQIINSSLLLDITLSICGKYNTYHWCDWGGVTLPNVPTTYQTMASEPHSLAQHKAPDNIEAYMEFKVNKMTGDDLFSVVKFNV